MRKAHQPHTKKNGAALTALFGHRLVDKEAKGCISVCGLGISSGMNHRVVLNMIPASRLEYMVAESVGELHRRDGQMSPADHKQSDSGKESLRRSQILKTFSRFESGIRRNLASFYG